MTQFLIYAAAIVVGVLSIGRIVRLVTQDSFPPSVWLRIKWDNLTDESGWNPLLHCHWCLAPWIVAPIGAWALLSDFHISWWLFNGWLAISYGASMIVERDEAE